MNAYDMDIVHRSDKKNDNVNGLSRGFLDRPATGRSNTVRSYKRQEPFGVTSYEMRLAQLGDVYCPDLINRNQKGEPVGLFRTNNDIRVWAGPR